MEYLLAPVPLTPVHLLTALAQQEPHSSIVLYWNTPTGKQLPGWP